MKKFLTIAAVAVFVFTLAAATYAVDFKASGYIRVRSAVYMNTDGAPDATLDNYDDTEAWMDQRFRLKMDLVASEDLYGVIQFEGDSTKWGENPAGATRNAAGAWGAGGSDRAAVELKQFYIDFVVPGISEFARTRVRAGTQWLAIRGHAFLGADGAGVKVTTSPGPAKLSLAWFKPGEGTDYQADDTDLYAVDFQLALPDFPVRPGAFFAYWNANEYPLWTAGLAQADFYWIGVNVDGKIGPANLKTDFIYVNGDVEQTVATLANPDLDYSGWLVYADVNVPISQFTVGGLFMYATGDDRSEVGISQDRKGYVIPPGSEANPNLSMVFWCSTVNDAVDIVGGSNGARTGGNAAVQPRWFGGVWTAKGYANFKPLDWLKVTGYAMYIGDTVKDGNAIGNAVDPAEASGLEDEDYIGIEVGAIADIKIYKELTYSIGAGYLFAGDAMDSFTGVGVANDSPDDPWAIVSQLIYKF